MSESSTGVRQFHWADYLVFGASLLVSIGIGIYFAVMERRKKNSTSSDFLMAGRNAQTLPVAMSMLASFMSAIFIIGVPSEIYLYGTMFAVNGVGWTLSALIGAQVYVPVFHSMGVTSAYEYLQKRFNKVVRVLGSLSFILLMMLYMSVVLYAPAIAFTTVTGLTMWVTVFGIGVICTIYTSIGGMKAVIWTDTFQMIVIFAGVVALVAKGTADVGGVHTLVKQAQSRIDFSNTSPALTERHTWWTQTIGTTVNMLGLVAGNQIIIQRYLSIRKVKDAQMSIYLAVAGALVLLVLCTMLGLVIYAYYDCDPLTRGTVRIPEEIVPLFMMDTLGHLHGLPGLFTASVFAASLSTVSSAVQSLAAVVIEDMIRPAYTSLRHVSMSERAATWTAKALAVFFGLLTIGLSYLAPYLGPQLIQISLSIFGTAGGPLLGLFSLAIFFPCANSWGAGVGLITSIVLTYWLNVGAIITKPPPTRLPLKTAPCSNFTESGQTVGDLYNTTGTVGLSLYTSTTSELPLYNTTTGMPVGTSGDALLEWYKISYAWYGCFSVLVVLIVGLIISALTCFRRGEPPLEKRLVFSFADSCCCSRSCRERLSCRRRSPSCHCADKTSEDNLGVENTPDEINFPGNTNKFTFGLQNDSFTESTNM